MSNRDHVLGRGLDAVFRPEHAHDVETRGPQQGQRVVQLARDRRVVADQPDRQARQTGGIAQQDLKTGQHRHSSEFLEP